MGSVPGKLYQTFVDYIRHHFNTCDSHNRVAETYDLRMSENATMNWPPINRLFVHPFRTDHGGNIDTGVGLAYPLRS